MCFGYIKYFDLSIRRHCAHVFPLYTHCDSRIENYFLCKEKLRLQLGCEEYVKEIRIWQYQQSDSNFQTDFTDELRDQTSVIQLETVDYALQPSQKQQTGRKEPTKAYELLAHLSGMPL